jgi:hypothetical protein
MNIRNIATVALAAILAFGIGTWVSELGMERVAAQTTGLSGSFGFQATMPISSSNTALSAAVGVMTFDGAGNVSINQTFVETDTAAGATALKVQPPGPITGTYTINADNTGTMGINLGGDKPTPFAFVLTEGGNSIQFLQTGGGNVLLIGAARKI